MVAQVAEVRPFVQRNGLAGVQHREERLYQIRNAREHPARLGTQGAVSPGAVAVDVEHEHVPVFVGVDHGGDFRFAGVDRVIGWQTRPLVEDAFKLGADRRIALGDLVEFGVGGVDIEEDRPARTTDVSREESVEDGLEGVIIHVRPPSQWSGEDDHATRDLPRPQ